MAKDEATLLSEIVGLLRKQNQLSTRDRLREAEEAKRQEKATATTEAGISMSEEIQLQGVAFMDRFIAGQAKTAMDRLTGDKPTKTMQEVGNTLTGINRVLLTDISMSLDNYLGPSHGADLFDLKVSNHAIREYSANHLPNIDKWTSLIKANSDVLVWDGKDIKHGIQALAAEIGSHSLNVYDAEADADADAEQARWKDEDKQRADDLRTAEEERREGQRKLVDKNNTLIPAGFNMKNMRGSAGGLWKSLKGLPLMLIGWAIGGGVLAIKDFITGWKEDGFAGAVGKMLGGSGEGLWNSIKQAFKVGGLGAMIGGAIGFLFGGIGAIPGAIIGGLIGMALGAIFGYIGGDKITAKLKEAGAGVAKLWGKGVGFIMYHLRRIGEWFYSPGQPANPHVSGKSEIFGGFISWDPGNFSLKALWDSAIDSIWGMVKDIGKWFWDDGKVFGGRLTIPTWDEIFADFKESMANMWDVIANIPKHIKRGLMSILPDWMLKGLGWIKDAPVGPGSLSHLRGEERAEVLFAKDSKSMDPWFGDSKEAFLQLVNSGQLGATNAGQLDGNLVGKMTNFDGYGNWIGPGSPANNALLMAEQKRKFAALGGGQQNVPAPVIITDSGNDKSSQTIIQYFDRAPYAGVTGVYPPSMSSMSTPLNQKF
jgi:hypothetical protein